ncbi:hypothetical protein TRFO_19215 [Tritrichomonas foetus]|uniref:Right handed beta helix domain-containing protein n=1 Tax=Tritrichomonas foetus TaxID=1144522 RepID=A0A1J4KJE7_9EUKA|nr:hypothetical protein TRFO_19215 [Tritrichomonas foetus]|eukprot:OHT11339.1 hypothetical protein TRFO_19215 [Tritrichomonas foetus]
MHTWSINQILLSFKKGMFFLILLCFSNSLSVKSIECQKYDKNASIGICSLSDKNFSDENAEILFYFLLGSAVFKNCSISNTLLRKNEGGSHSSIFCVGNEDIPHSMHFNLSTVGCQISGTKGGTVFNVEMGGSLNIEDCNFSENSGNNAVLLVEPSDGIEININSSVFVENQPNHESSIFYTDVLFFGNSVNHEINISNCQFINKEKSTTQFHIIDIVDGVFCYFENCSFSANNENLAKTYIKIEYYPQLLIHDEIFSVEIKDCSFCVTNKKAFSINIINTKKERLDGEIKFSGFLAVNSEIIDDWLEFSFLYNEFGWYDDTINLDDLEIIMNDNCFFENENTETTSGGDSETNSNTNLEIDSDQSIGFTTVSEISQVLRPDSSFDQNVDSSNDTQTNSGLYSPSQFKTVSTNPSPSNHLETEAHTKTKTFTITQTVELSSNDPEKKSKDIHEQIIIIICVFFSLVVISCVSIILIRYFLKKDELRMRTIDNGINFIDLDQHVDTSI